MRAIVFATLVAIHNKLTVAFSLLIHFEIYRDPEWLRLQDP